MAIDALTPAADYLEKLLPHCLLQHYPGKSVLIQAGAPCNSLYFILSGSVTVLIEDNQGKEIVIAYLNEGDVLGELGLFSQHTLGTPRSACARTRTTCEVAEISYEKFIELAAKDPRMLYMLGSQMAERLRNTTRKVGDLAFLDATGRVARTLLDLCKQPDALTHPEGMQIRITRQEIGRIVGCSREMVGRVLRDLETSGLIHVRGKTMVIYGARPNTAKKKTD